MSYKSTAEAIKEAEEMLNYYRHNIKEFGQAQDSNRSQLWWNPAVDDIEIYHPDGKHEFYFNPYNKEIGYWQGAVGPTGFPKAIYLVFICNL